MIVCLQLSSVVVQFKGLSKFRLKQSCGPNLMGPQFGRNSSSTSGLAECHFVDVAA